MRSSAFLCHLARPFDSTQDYNGLTRSPLGGGSCHVLSLGYVLISLAFKSCENIVVQVSKFVCPISNLVVPPKFILVEFLNGVLFVVLGTLYIVTSV